MTEKKLNLILNLVVKIYKLSIFTPFLHFIIWFCFLSKWDDIHTINLRQESKYEMKRYCSTWNGKCEIASTEHQKQSRKKTISKTFARSKIFFVHFVTFSSMCILDCIPVVEKTHIILFSILFYFVFFFHSLLNILQKNSHFTNSQCLSFVAPYWSNWRDRFRSHSRRSRRPPPPPRHCVAENKNSKCQQ